MKRFVILSFVIVILLGSSFIQDFSIAETSDYLEENFSIYNKLIDDYRIISAIVLAKNCNITKELDSTKTKRDSYIWETYHNKYQSKQ